MAETSLVRVGIGQNSRRFLSAESSKPCLIGGLVFEGVPGFASDSDGDVVFLALCNALSSLTGVPILGGLAVDLCEKDGITDSKVSLEKVLPHLRAQRIQHVAISIEGRRPRLQPHIEQMRQKVATVLQLDFSQVGITATSGEGLTDFGCGDGLQCFCIVTTVQTGEES